MKTKIIPFPLRENKSPALDKGTSWKGYTGAAATTDLIGIEIPKGVFVIDLDTYKYEGLTHEAINKALGVKLDWETSLIQKTLSGGAHHAFSIPEDVQLLNATDVLLDGLDTRSSNKGYIATGKGYTDTTEDGIIETFEMADFSLPALPVEAIEKFKVKISPVACSGLATAVANANRLELTLDEIKDYLDRLPESAADDNWLTVVMGMYHETQGSEEGYELLDEWSKTCPAKYDETKNRGRWDSMCNNTNPNPITFKSVIMLAGGKETVQALSMEQLKEKIEQSTTRDDLEKLFPEVANSNASTIDEAVLIGEIQKKFSAVGAKISKPDLKKAIRKHKISDRNSNFVDDYVFCTSSGLYVNRENLATMGPRSFATKHNRDTPLNSEGVQQSAPNYADFLIETVDDTMCMPREKPIFKYLKKTWFNTFTELEHEQVDWKTKEDEVNVILNHAKWLLPDDRDREILLSFVAHQVQNKGKLLRWALVLQGKQGDGKTFFADLMGELLGDQNVGTITPAQFGNHFNSWAHGKLVNVVEELKVPSGTSQYDVVNQVKPLITNAKITVEGKGQDSKTVINSTNYFCTTNFKDAVPIDNGDRRWCIIFAPERDMTMDEFNEKNPSYFTKLHETMGDNIPELYNYFLTYEIPEWFKNSLVAPMTNHKKQMITFSKSNAELLFENAIEDFGEGAGAKFITEQRIDLTYLTGRVQDSINMGDVEYKDFPKTGTLRKILLSRGYVQEGKRKRINGVMHTIYIKEKMVE